MNNYDGKIVIGTQIDTKQFDAQIKNLENKLNDVEASLQMASEDKTLFSADKSAWKPSSKGKKKEI